MAAKLVNVKIDPKEREKDYAETVPVDRPMYPWGLQVNLDHDVLEKLGLDKLPEVGSTLMLVARVDVASVSSNEHASDSDGGKPHKHRNVGLQITDLCLEAVKDSKSADETLYASAKG